MDCDWSTALDLPQSVDVQEHTDCIEVPIQLKRMGMAVHLIVGGLGGQDTNSEHPNGNQKILALLRRARQWFDELASGRYTSIADLAQAKQMTASYVTRVLYLALISPDIVQIIAQGRHPHHISADTLMRLGRPPINWAEQYASLGMKNSGDPAGT